MRTLLLTLTTCLLVLPAQAKYSGGTGEPNDPYQIATAADLIALGETPEDYDKCFVLTADIDLDPNLPGRKVFDKAVIAPDPEEVTHTFHGIPFTGVFDGNAHNISHLTIKGGGYLGLFGDLESGGEIRNLGLIGPDVRTQWENFVGSLVGISEGTVTGCHVEGGSVKGWDCVGALVGRNSTGAHVTTCYSTGAVSGTYRVGGLVGDNGGDMDLCYSVGAVNGFQQVGGVVGANDGNVTNCFWDTQTSGQATSAGGMPMTTAEMQTAKTFLDVGWFKCDQAVTWTINEGKDYPRLWWENKLGKMIGPVRLCDFLGGTGTKDDPYQISTAEELNLAGLAICDYDKHFILTDDIDLDPNLPGGRVFEKALIAPDVNDATPWFEGTPFAGVFDGNGHTILHLTINGDSWVGLFGQLTCGGEVKNLGVVDVNVAGSGNCVGTLAGSSNGTVIRCYSTGAVSGKSSVGGLVGAISYGSVTDCYSGALVRGTGDDVGGLVGCNIGGDVTQSYSTGQVSGMKSVGGLVGENVIYSTGGLGGWDYRAAHISECHSTGSVEGDVDVGGLVGCNTAGEVMQSYSTATVSGHDRVGGLVGLTHGVSGTNWGFGWCITESYSVGSVTGDVDVGGLVGSGDAGLEDCFWDTQTSGQTTSAGGTGKNTAEMQAASTFLDAGWDFVGETANGTEDIWKIAEGVGYPRLLWEKYSGGTGEANDPYQVATAADLIALGETPADYDKCFVLTADIDLDPNLPARKVFDKAVIAPDTDPCDIYWWTGERCFTGPSFTGHFDGDGYTISHLTIKGGDYLGLFGRSGQFLVGGHVENLGIVCVNITGSGNWVGGLAGEGGAVTSCYSTGVVSGADYVGGLVGFGSYTTHCYTTGAVSGCASVGGLVGYNISEVNQCYSTAVVTGELDVGGLVGCNDSGNVMLCYSTGAVSGDSGVGGLVGHSASWVGPGVAVEGIVSDCYSTGDVRGRERVGGLVGENSGSTDGIQCITTRISRCYSVGRVFGEVATGGFMGLSGCGPAEDSFWDAQTSGQATSGGYAEGKTTAEMQTAKTFLDAGWDFVGETANGTEDIWWILEGKDYPRLWWEAAAEPQP